MVWASPHADKKSRFFPRPTGLLDQAGRLRRQVLLPDGEDPALPGLPQDQALNLEKKVENKSWQKKAFGKSKYLCTLVLHALLDM